MKSLKFLVFAGVVLAQLPILVAKDFEFAVRHHHALRDCQGTLKITLVGVEYQTGHKKDSREWKFEEIRTIKVESPTEISLSTYEDQRRFFDKDRAFNFTLTKEKVTPDLSAFLLSRVKRPMVLAVLHGEDRSPAYEIRAKHLHVLGGAMGMLRIYPDRVLFQSSQEGDSRLWRLSDIQRFSQPDRFRFQIVSYVPKAGGPTEVYNFLLLEDLSEGVYDYLWVRLNPSSYYPNARQNQQ